ncbi:NUDIX hydrolase [Streptomyces gulbargensis]|uniref:NUDIX hydrolase n=1 Tax=Streptomyces gulbargensis TaxID=364901 RepID=A0ABP7LMR4_9ACTN
MNASPARRGPGPGAGPGAVTPVLAAGCVLWRPAISGHPDGSAGPAGIEVAVIHRPKWDDWSHPKGKRKKGETAEECALREVLEETGQDCALGARLPTVRYTVSGRPKVVDYWAGRALSGTFVPTREVDALLWLPPAEARARLTRPEDRALLDALPVPPAHR